MSEHDQPEFDDPQLKAAVRRVLADEQAPKALRERIVGIMVAGEAKPAAQSRGSGRWRISVNLGDNPVRTLLAACVALLAVGVLAYQVKVNLFPEQPAPGRYIAPTLSESFAMEMVQTHSACAKLADHHLVAGDDFAKLRETLTAQLKMPVAALALPGWQFKGAGICKVGMVTGAHL